MASELQEILSVVRPGGKCPQSLHRKISRLLVGKEEKKGEGLWLLTKTFEFINCEKDSTEKIKNSN